VSQPLVVVSYGADAAMEQATREALGPDVELVYSTRMSEDERRDAITRAEALLTWSLEHELPEEMLEGAKELRFLQLLSAGVDHVDLGRVPEQVVIASNVGAYAEPMAEHVMAMALSCAKRLPLRQAGLARGEFDQRSLSLTLDGAVCGIVGFGGIGKATARLMRAFGAEIWAINTSGSTDEPVSFVGTMSDLDRVFAGSDVLVLSVPLKRSTHGLISAHELSLMKPTAILVNVARGEIVDQRALYEHLKANPECWAAIDTWWDEPAVRRAFRTDYPFLELPNVIGSPHNSPLVASGITHAVQCAAQNVRRYLDGAEPAGIVRREEYVEEG